MNAPADPSLPFMVHDTSTIAVGDRFASWHQALSGTFDVPRPDGHDLARFNVRADVWHLGEVLASTTRFGARLGGERTTRIARADQVDHYRLILQLKGSLRVDADGRRLIAQPGQLMLTDMARDHVYDRDQGSCIFLFLPREMLDDALPRPMDLHAFVPQGGAAAMLADHLQALMRHMPGMKASQANSMSISTVSLIAAALAPTAHTLESARSTIESTVLRQACRYIDLHLTEPDLSPQSICGVLKISRATLYRMFEPFGGVSAHVKERRLTRIHEKLSASDTRYPLARLAEDYGFKTATHFSAAFRQMFGYSPSEARSMQTAPASSRGVERPNELVFRSWLRSLRG